MQGKGLNIDRVKERLCAEYIGKNLILLDTIDSTNNYLKKLGAEGCESGTVVASREQTAGKGRLGRVWLSEKDSCLMFSFLLRPRIKLAQVSAITPLCGLALCKAIREYTGLECMIKWPNDVIVGRKKLAGILTEISISNETDYYTVTGVGLNVAQTCFDDEIAHKATSLFLETDKDFDINKLFAVVLRYIEKELEENNFKVSKKALEEYTAMCATLGREVEFLRNGEKLSGTAVEIDANGELIVKLADLSVYKVSSGEVTVQGIY